MSVGKTTELSPADIKEIMSDFDDFDAEIENVSEVEYGELYAKSLDAAMVELSAMLQLPPTATLNDRSVKDIIDLAIKAFRMTWEREAAKLLQSQIGEAVKRGVLLDKVFSEKEIS
jgi:ketopantoate reductase